MKRMKNRSLREFEWDLTKFLKAPAIEEFRIQAAKFDCGIYDRCGRNCVFYKPEMCVLNRALLKPDRINPDGHMLLEHTGTDELPSIYLILAEAEAKIKVQGADDGRS